MFFPSYAEPYFPQAGMKSTCSLAAATAHACTHTESTESLKPPHLLMTADAKQRVKSVNESREPCEPCESCGTVNESREPCGSCESCGTVNESREPIGSLVRSVLQPARIAVLEAALCAVCYSQPGSLY